MPLGPVIFSSLLVAKGLKPNQTKQHLNISFKKFFKPKGTGLINWTISSLRIMNFSSKQQFEHQTKVYFIMYFQAPAFLPTLRYYAKKLGLTSTGSSFWVPDLIGGIIQKPQISFSEMSPLRQSGISVVVIIFTARSLIKIL